MQRSAAAEEALAEARAVAEAATAERNELAAQLSAREAELKARTAELLAIRDGAAAEASVAGSSVHAALDKVRLVNDGADTTHLWQACDIRLSADLTTITEQNTQLRCLLPGATAWAAQSHLYLLSAYGMCHALLAGSCRVCAGHAQSGRRAL